MIKLRLLSRRGRYGNPIGIFLFLLPGLGVYTLLMLYPTVQSFIYSVVKWEGMRPAAEFGGFGYYAQMLEDPVVLIALGNNLRALALRVLVQLPIALLLAFALSRKVRGVSLFRFLFYIPCVTSGAALALLWRFIYNSQYGIINSLLRRLGMASIIRPWLSTDGIVQWTTNIPETWQWVGFYMVILLAAINGIPEEHFEAAQLDGANAWHELIYITLPSIRSVYLATNIAVLNDALITYVYQFILTDGGPLHLSETLTTYTLKQIWTLRNWGYGSTLAVLQFCLAMISAMIVWRLARRQPREIGG